MRARGKNQKPSVRSTSQPAKMLQMLEGATHTSAHSWAQGESSERQTKKCKKEYVEKFQPSTVSTLEFKKVIISNELLIQTKITYPHNRAERCVSLLECNASEEGVNNLRKFTSMSHHTPGQSLPWPLRNDDTRCTPHSSGAPALWRGAWCCEEPTESRR